ncbi:DUF2715 domain-containing protein [Treponema pedis]|uniref:DUF2715 domain-containing protein n=2 Tax=Treponema pedis TaxID=409322 RepID=UPI00040AA800|nr:DUF2715 domain-containing protein [Treponema pedis]
MKHKKNFIIFIMAAACTAMLFADLAISFGPAYTNYLVKPKTEEGKLSGNAVQDSIISQLKGATTEKNNAAGFAVDIRGDYLYGMLQIAFPSKTHTDLIKGGTAGLKKGAFIMDTQVGAGYTFFKDSRFNLFLGAGLGFNLMSSEQTISIPLAGDFNYKKLDAMIGVGGNITASFYFTKHVGIFAGIADTVYFAPIKAKKTFTVAGETINLDEKTEGTKLSNSFANSLNLKAGISFKL